MFLNEFSVSHPFLIWFCRFRFSFIQCFMLSFWAFLKAWQFHSLVSTFIHFCRILQIINLKLSCFSDQWFFFSGICVLHVLQFLLLFIIWIHVILSQVYRFIQRILYIKKLKLPFQILKFHFLWSRYRILITIFSILQPW